ncbi:TsaC protein (YrdC domain) required for threonylcarbamoyladenosine t(6)A37 modification in tRNA [Hydrogenimonas sp.]|nr:TsaC protein (YrdC domain) required for threonylcarbamoyladenosine t(6)A37 modification in tRNA [Hydrogenimonas sp.]
MRTELVYLVQTDTTAGFLSQSKERLAEAKGRPLDRPFLKAVSRLSMLEECGRVPKAFRKSVRRSRKRSFILPNGNSFRYIRGKHREFVKKFGWCYSTSANRHGEPFDEEYARDACDVVVESKEGFHEAKASEIWRLGREKRVKIR